MSESHFSVRKFVQTDVVVLAVVAVTSVGCEFGPWSKGTQTNPAGGRAATAASEKDAHPSVTGRDSRGNGALSMRGTESAGSKARTARPRSVARARPVRAGRAAARPQARPTAAVALDEGVRSDGSPWIGGKNAKVVIQEFSDFGCPFCRMGAMVMHKLLEHFGRKIKVVFRQMPITALHPDSFLAAEASLAAAAQGKFWAMHDLLFAHPHAHSRQDLLEYARKLGLDMARFRKDLDGHRFKTKIEADSREGAKRGVQGTPTFFVTGRGKVEGYLPFDAFRKIVEDQLSSQ